MSFVGRVTKSKCLFHSELHEVGFELSNVGASSDTNHGGMVTAMLRKGVDDSVFPLQLNQRFWSISHSEGS